MYVIQNVQAKQGTLFVCGPFLILLHRIYAKITLQNFNNVV